MSGETNSVNDKLERIKTALDSYERQVGLPPVSLNNEVDQYFSLTMDQLRKLDVEECGYVAILLSNMAHNIQRQFNKENSILKWAKSELSLQLASVIGSYSGSSFEERKMKAVAEHNNLKKLYKIASYAESRAERLNFISTRINDMSNTILGLQQLKRYQK